MKSYTSRSSAKLRFCNLCAVDQALLLPLRIWVRIFFFLHWLHWQTKGFYLLNSLNSAVLMLQAIERYSDCWDCHIETPLIRLILHLLCLFSAPQALCVLFAKVEARFFFFFFSSPECKQFFFTYWCHSDTMVSYLFFLFLFFSDTWIILSMTSQQLGSSVLFNNMALFFWQLFPIKCCFSPRSREKASLFILFYTRQLTFWFFSFFFFISLRT